VPKAVVAPTIMTETKDATKAYSIAVEPFSFFRRKKANRRIEKSPQRGKGTIVFTSTGVIPAKAGIHLSFQEDGKRFL
jgi:hypothetical protein